jgi:diguanylate cyclase (GGDEF)-like protein
LIAGQLAVSLDNALLYASLERKVAERTEALEQSNQRLEILSVTDPLTGLANRRRFQEVLAAEWESAQRRQCPIGVAMVDIDYFKLYNDTYGHLAGDACLRLVSATLNDSVRHGSDMVARYGGEEFAFILTGADCQLALAIAERARAAVTALHAPHAGSVCGIVTVSIGVAAIVPAASARVEAFLESADHALYEAKRGGRNGVSVATLV